MRVSKFLPAKVIYYIKRVLLPVHRIIKNIPTASCIGTKKEIHSDGVDIFFGYYDISPFSPDGRRILYLEHKKNDKTVKIILNSVTFNNRKEVAESRAWNWQQGVRLRWFPGSETEISFNDYIDGRYICRILSISAGTERRIDWPLYDISKDGTKGLSLDFARLGEKRPGYGYTCYTNEEKGFENNGIFLVDIAKNELIAKITYSQIARSIKSEIGNFSDYYINHLSFSPDGSKFLFFWINVQDGYHMARMIVCDIKSNELIPLEISRKVSHYAWANNDEILCTVFNENQQCGYFMYSVSKYTCRAIRPDILTRDGHPSFIDDNTIITDTYPDKWGFQELIIADLNGGGKTTVARFYSIPVKEAERRTDLHPRLSPDKGSVCVDVNSHGVRDLVILDMEKPTGR